MSQTLEEMNSRLEEYGNEAVSVNSEIKSQGAQIEEIKVDISNMKKRLMEI